MKSPGALLYKIYFNPIAQIKKLLRTGIVHSLVQGRERKEMMKASYDLKEITYKEAPVYEVYFLTGKKYWYQTAFCLYSFQKQSEVNIKAIMVDDGSFDDELEQQLLLQFPSSTIVRKEQMQALLDIKLPESEYPVLRKRRMEYPHLRKLTDIHILPGEDWKLVMDSDMLFFKKPYELLHWLRKPQKMLFLADTEDAYGYPVPLLKGLAAVNHFPRKLNVGIVLMPSSAIDWKALEFWTKFTIEQVGTSYLQEQALTAIIASKNEYELLPDVTYKVLPKINGSDIKEIVHHYVANSKYDYFVKGWKRAL